MCSFKAAQPEKRTSSWIFWSIFYMIIGCVTQVRIDQICMHWKCAFMGSTNHDEPIWPYCLQKMHNILAIQHPPLILHLLKNQLGLVRQVSKCQPWKTHYIFTQNSSHKPGEYPSGWRRFANHQVTLSTCDAEGGEAAKQLIHPS